MSIDAPVAVTLTTYAKALTEALRTEMERDPRVIVLGEDIGIGGVFSVTTGLLDRFGRDRVIDTPIAEAGFVGIGAGAAIAGLRPIVELMFVEFSLPAADQVFNQVAKLGALSNGRYDVPITIRTQQGIVGGGGPQHSQSLESLFAHVPGIAVAMPSTPADAKGLLSTAVRMDEPAMVIENKALYFTKGEVPTGEHLVPFGSATVVRDGDQVTLVAYSQAVRWALQAADELASRHGIAAEVVDLRTVMPLDVETVAASVSKTGAAVVVQESPGFASVSSEIVAQVTERCWADLRMPVRRVTGMEMPVPYAATLERRWLPSVEDVVGAVLDMQGSP